MNVFKRLLAIAGLLSMFMFNFAGTAIMGDISISARVCRDLGLLEGQTGEDINLAYTSSIPTRMQAAKIYLRLLGLDKTAMSYEGKENFLDADKASAEEQKIMAYMKMHPEHGFVGNPDGSFQPNAPMTAQAYYKLLLIALGYDAGKDFSWDTVFDFAKEKGMSRLTAADNEFFTVDKLCIATIEGLKANLKDGSKSLIKSLVEKGIFDSSLVEVRIN